MCGSGVASGRGDATSPWGVQKHCFVSPGAGSPPTPSLLHIVEPDETARTKSPEAIKLSNVISDSPSNLRPYTTSPPTQSHCSSSLAQK